VTGFEYLDLYLSDTWIWILIAVLSFILLLIIVVTICICCKKRHARRPESPTCDSDDLRTSPVWSKMEAFGWSNTFQLHHVAPPTQTK